jgi:hypothetical protein
MATCDPAQTLSTCRHH